VSKLSLGGRRWLDLCTLVKDRDGWQCTACGNDQDLSVDHIIPLAALTEDDWINEKQYDSNNLATLCRRCNGIKSDRTTIRQAWACPTWPRV
jgi:5-methylcytosine-specific restriction endonuclease McrA